MRDNATGKRVDNWLQNQSTKQLLAEFLDQQTKLPGIPGSLKEPIITISGRTGGTWAHPDIATHSIRKYSLEFCFVWTTINLQFDRRSLHLMSNFTTIFGRL